MAGQSERRRGQQQRHDQSNQQRRSSDNQPHSNGDDSDTFGGESEDYEATYDGGGGQIDSRRGEVTGQFGREQGGGSSHEQFGGRGQSQIHADLSGQYRGYQGSSNYGGTSGQRGAQRRESAGQFGAQGNIDRGQSQSFGSSEQLSGGRGQDGVGYGQGTESRGQYFGRGPKGYKRTDERIQEEICETLCRHGEIDASEIECSVKDGEVTLTGTVNDRSMKRMAEDVIENISGVTEVHNQIRVNRDNGKQR